MMRNHRDGTFRDVTAETGLNQTTRATALLAAGRFQPRWLARSLRGK